jgi:outer membrane protein OmpA-like peptidoglycan-associated protein
MNTRNTLLATGLVASLAISGCATDDPNRRAKTGAVFGAIIGAVAGKELHDEKGMYIGAALGALTGGAVGNYMDDQQAELEQALKEEQDAEALKITRLPDNSLLIGIASEASFDVNQSNVKSQFLGTFQKIGEVLKDYETTVVHVIGHTDSSGSTEYNQGLSEKRSASVGSVLVGQGLDQRRLKTEGRGEMEPIAGNGTAEGRKKNRRVDIVIKPIVEDAEESAFRSPGFLGS